jgi:hypothetical protein
MARMAAPITPAPSTVRRLTLVFRIFFIFTSPI